MSDENHGSEVKVSNWTLATGTRPGERFPIAVVSERTDAQRQTSVGQLEDPGAATR